MSTSSQITWAIRIWVSWIRAVCLALGNAQEVVHIAGEFAATATRETNSGDLERTADLHRLENIGGVAARLKWRWQYPQPCPERAPVWQKLRHNRNRWRCL